MICAKQLSPARHDTHARSDATENARRAAAAQFLARSNERDVGHADSTHTVRPNPVRRWTSARGKELVFERYIAARAHDPRERRTWVLPSSIATLAMIVALGSLYIGERLGVERVRGPRAEVDSVIRLPTLQTVTPVWGDAAAPRSPRAAGDGTSDLVRCTALDVFHNRWSPKCSIPRPGTVCAMTRGSCRCSPARIDTYPSALLRLAE